MDIYILISMGMELRSEGRKGALDFELLLAIRATTLLLDFVLLADPVKLKMKFTYFFTVLLIQILETGFTGK